MQVAAGDFFLVSRSADENTVDVDGGSGGTLVIRNLSALAVEGISAQIPAATVRR
jgi:hypothetical protein